MHSFRVMAAAMVGIAAAHAGAQTQLERALHDDRRTVLVVSHRACWKMASENSLEGIRACIATGIDMVEIDVRTTKDDALILMHDETVDRTTNGTGGVAELSHRDLARLHLRAQGGGSGALVTARRVPTFTQALAAVRGRILMNIDVKAASLDRILDEVIAAGAECDVVLNVPIDVDGVIVQRAAKAGIAIQPVYLERQSRAPVETAMAALVALRPTSIQLIFDHPLVLETARAATGSDGPRLFVNTMASDIASGRDMNLSGPYLDTRAVEAPDAIWGRLIERGVTIVQTDEPWRLRDYLKLRGLR